MALAATDSIWMAKRIPSVEGGDAQVSGLNKDYGACRQVVKTSGCDSDMRGFESHQAPQLDV